MSTHILDMFPEGPIGEPVDGQECDPRLMHPFYSLKGIKTINYKDVTNSFMGLSYSNLDLPSSDWKFYCDGIRFRKFGLQLWLTKHALFKVGGGLIPYHHAHLHWNMKIANISSVLYHYKFPPHFAAQVATALRERQYCNNSSDYIRYGNTINSDQSIVFKDDSAKKLESVDELVDQSFLDVPDVFKSYVESSIGEK
jgi:hypothetical protein